MNGILSLWVLKLSATTNVGPPGHVYSVERGSGGVSCFGKGSFALKNAKQKLSTEK